MLTTTPKETQSLAKKLLPKIFKKRLVLLSGELGSGKTTFVKGLAKSIGIKKVIKSPTFSYLNKYSLSSLKAKSYKLKAFHHFDLYRFPQNHSLSELGFEEAMCDSKNIVVIEWADKFPELKNFPHVEINFEKRDNDHLICYTF